MDNENDLIITITADDIDPYSVIIHDSMLSNASGSSLTIDASTIDFGSTVDWINQWQKEQEWQDILKASETNQALQAAIERVKILYYLSKDDGSKT